MVKGVKMLLNIKKLLGPIRRCIQLGDTSSYVCSVKTPGFTAEMLKTEITHNGLFIINGDTNIMDGDLFIRRCRVHEAIYLPPRVRTETIRWRTQNGITILRCENSPSSMSQKSPVFANVVNTV